MTRRGDPRAIARQRQGLAQRNALDLQAPLDPVTPRSATSSRAREPRWQDRASRRARDAQLQRQPFCELRLAGCQGKAIEVDHVRLRAAGGSMTDPSNLRSVCASCHDQRHGKSRRPRVKGCFVNGTPRDPEHPWYTGGPGKDKGK